MIKYLEKLEDFDKITTTDKNVFVDFFATWCGPCRMMGREIEEIENDYKDLTFLKVDVDKFPEIAQRFMVTNIPSFIAYKDGKSISFKVNNQTQFMLVGALMDDDFKLLLNETYGF